MNSIKDQLIMFIVMVIVGMAFNPMSMLAYKYEHLYFKALNHTGLISDEEYSLITQQEEG